VEETAKRSALFPPMLHFWITELRWTAREYRLMPMSAFDVKADMAFRRANVCF
jgi:hypothetical protein